MHEFHMQLSNLVKQGKITAEQKHQLLKQAAKDFYSNVKCSIK